MANTLLWQPFIRWGQRLSMILTLGSCVYVVFFLFSKDKEFSVVDKSSIRSANTIMPSPVFDVKPLSSGDQVRDVFSLDNTAAGSGVENTPKGQLPDHLKVVGILVGHPSQIVIEDSSSNQTYFINEGTAQDGIKIVKVDSHQMIINYRGEDIPIPITKS